MTIAGEFNNAINDYGLYADGVVGSACHGLDCLLMRRARLVGLDQTGVAERYPGEHRRAWGLVLLDRKIGKSTTTGPVQTPLRSYQLGLENGWMPTDLQQALSEYTSLDATSAPFDGTYQAWQTGGAGAGTIPPSAAVELVWPPTSITSDPAGSVTALPQYTATGTLSTLLPPPFSASVTASVGNGGAR